MPAAGRIAFVAPRFPDQGTVGGAETLIAELAACAARSGREVSFLTTCARSHVTWANERPAGVETHNGMTVHFFPVDESRDTAAFHEAQALICRGRPVDRSVQETWLSNSVNSPALLQHLADAGYDRILAGPYLYGLVAAVVHALPAMTILVPCLHDEAFAYQDVIREMFQAAGGCIFNAGAERDLASRLYGPMLEGQPVVGMGLEPFGVEPGRFRVRHGLEAPYIAYSGRREPLKGTPLLLDYLAAFRARTGTDVRLAMTGTGPIEPPPELAPFILDVGYVTEEEKQALMADALAFCHPSVNESLGIVLLEAWLAGAPALVHAGSAVLRGHCAASGGGLWFRTYPEFEEALQLLIARPGLAAAMGKAGRAYTKREYSWEAVAPRLLAAIDR